MAVESIDSLAEFCSKKPVWRYIHSGFDMFLWTRLVQHRP